MHEFDLKKFEKAKADFMVKVQTRLRREQKKREWEEQQKKYREEEEKREKELLKTKYQYEIRLCENLMKEMQSMKPSANKETQEQTET